MHYTVRSQPVKERQDLYTMNAVTNPSSGVKLIDIRVSSIKIWLDQGETLINQAARRLRWSQILTIAEVDFTTLTYTINAFRHIPTPKEHTEIHARSTFR